MTIEFDGVLPTEISSVFMEKINVGGEWESKSVEGNTIKAELSENVIELEFSLDQKITSDIFYVVGVAFYTYPDGTIYFAIKALE